MRHFFCMVAALGIPATVWATETVHEKTVNDQLAEALRKYEALKEECYPERLPQAKARAVNRVRSAPKGLNAKERGEVMQMIENASCCDELRLAIKALDDRLTAVEGRLGVVEVTAGEAKNTADEAKATADKALAEAEKKPTVEVTERSSRVSVVTGTRFKLRVGAEVSGMSNFNYGLAFGAITGSAMWVTEEKWARAGKPERLGFVLFALDASIGLSFEKAIRQPLWASGGKLAWQWPLGLYLGVTGKTVAIGMSPTYHWIVAGGPVFGFSYPKPALQKPFGFFVEAWLGPAGHLANAPNWGTGWEPVLTGGLALGGQFL